MKSVFSSAQKRAAPAVTQTGRGRDAIWISGNNSKALESLPEAFRAGNETSLPPLHYCGAQEHDQNLGRSSEFPLETQFAGSLTWPGTFAGG